MLGPLKRISFLRPLLRYSFLQTKLTQEKLNELKHGYKIQPSLKIFESYIESSSDYFRIFKVIHQTKFDEHTYRDLFQILSKIKPKSDNVILLQSKILAAIAADYQQKKQYDMAKKIFNDAMDCIQNSLVPQIMQYYTLYRRYGLLLAEMKDEEAKEVLKESVTIIDEFVKNSEDPVSGIYNSIQQAKASINLYYLDQQQKEKWLQIANEEWKHCEGQQYQYIEYAQTVMEHARNKIKQNEKNRNRMKLFADVQIEKMKNQQECEHLRQQINDL